MYSWPGATSFSSEGLGALIGHGLLSTGMFQTFAANLFVFDQAIIKAAGEGVIDGRPMLRFTYSVPSLENHWDVDRFGSQGSLGEAGEFCVDRTDNTLVRLQVNATDIPATLPLKSLQVTVDYQRVSLDNKPELLPESAEFSVLDTHGKSYRNAMVFSHCHVFEAESKMAASGDNLRAVFARYEANRGVLPSGITLQVALETPVDAKNAKVGDAITARLRKPLQIGPEMMVPQGATLRGRIREFERVEDSANTFVVGLEFDELNWSGHSYRFLATMIFSQPIAGLSSALFSGHQSSRNVLDGTLFSSTTETLRASAIPGAATFFLKDVRALPKGFQMTWRTEQWAH
jgi:hypothetical protein